MFDYEFLARLRAAEMEFVEPRVRAGERLLEIGAGDGLQSQLLIARGVRVASLEIPCSIYGARRSRPVILYDGSRLPFRADVFDVVYSSNTLEHVKDRAALFREIRRVLAPNGRCVHVLPTSAWRLWTSLAHYPALAQECVRLWKEQRSGHHHLYGLRLLSRRLGAILLALRQRRWPSAHGEDGTAFRELWLFSRRRWSRVFREAGFEVKATVRMGIFYTGYMVLGRRLSLNIRRAVALALGSACRLYELSPVPNQVADAVRYTPPGQ